MRIMEARKDSLAIRVDDLSPVRGHCLDFLRRSNSRDSISNDPYCLRLRVLLVDRDHVRVDNCLIQANLFCHIRPS